MVKFKRKPFNPIDDSILEVLEGSLIPLTPSGIATIIRISPSTAQRRIKKLKKKHWVNCIVEGNRTYCELNRNKFK